MSAPPMEQVSAALEAIIRPIVEGQIRGFLKEHPSVLQGVDWYKRRTDKATTFTNSLAKRIIRDLTCGNVAARLETALLELVTDTPSDADRGTPTAAEPARLVFELSEREPYRRRKSRVMRAPGLAA
jgi:hypothetical protein